MKISNFVSALAMVASLAYNADAVALVAQEALTK